MAIPDTDTFSMQDVQNEFGAFVTNLATAVFEGVGEGGFDVGYNPNAFGENNNMLNFRNYGNVSTGRRGFSRTTNNYSSASGACNAVDVLGQGTMTVSYHNGTGTIPANGDTVFLAATGSAKLFTSGRYWGCFSDRSYTSVTFRTNVNGVAQDVTTCAPTAPVCLLSTNRTVTSPSNIAEDNGKLNIYYTDKISTLQYSLNGAAFIDAPVQTNPSGAFTLTGFSPGSGAINFKQLNNWPNCTRSLNYTIVAPSFTIVPTGVDTSVSSDITILGTNNNITTRVYSFATGALALTSTSNPVDLSSLANNTYRVQVTQASPNILFPGPTSNDYVTITLF